MANNYTTVSKKGIEYLCSLINQLANVSEGIDDLNLRTDGTFSSVKIDTLLNTLKTDCNDYTDRLVANLSRLELKIATSESEITQPNTMYLYKPSGSSSYEQYVVIEGTKVLLGTCDIDMGDYYTITQTEAKFCLATDFNDLTTSFNNLKTAHNTHVADSVAHLTQEERDKMLTTNDIATSISNAPSDDKVVSEKAVDSAIKKVTFFNPNLLDNSWFTVNQRGKTSYTGMGYGVDRWKSYSSANTVEVNSDGSITVTNTGDGRGYFGQVADMEYIKKLKGKTVTLSIDGFCSSGVYLYFHIKNGSVGENISDTAKNKIGTTRAIYSMTITVPDKDFTYSEWLNFSINPGESVTIYSAKVELGSVSTLHLDVAPNYQQELAKCQRYYQRTNIQAGAAIAHGCIRFANANTKTAEYRIFIHTSQPMLKVPLIGYNNLKIFDFMSGEDVMVDETLTGLNKIKIKDLSIYTYGDTMIQLKLSTRNTTTKGTELVQGGVVALLADGAWTDSYIEFSAEL